MHCPNCDTKNPDNALFCDECGFPLSGSISRAAGGASPTRLDNPDDNRPASGQDSSTAGGIDPDAWKDDGGESSEARGWTEAAEARFEERVRNRNDFLQASYKQPASTPYAADEAMPFEDTSYRQGQELADLYDEYPRMRAPQNVEYPPLEGLRDAKRRGDSEDRAANQSLAGLKAYESFDPFEDSDVFDDFDPFWSGAHEPVVGHHPNIEAARDDGAFAQAGASGPAATYNAGDVSVQAAVEDEGAQGYTQKLWGQGPQDQDAPASSPKSLAKRDFRANTTGGDEAGRRRVIILLVALLVAAAAIGIGGYQLGLWGGKIVPDVIGSSEDDAQGMLEERNFSMKTVQEKSDETEGIVLFTEPAVGSHVPEGTEVLVHIASARFVPDIVGLGISEATGVLKEAGYESITYENDYTDGEEDLVTAVSPEAGTRAKSTMEIVVKVSKHYQVPDIAGQDLEGALKTIEDAGLVPEVIYVDTDQVDDGTIMGTTPEVGTKMSAGDYVSVTVSRTRGVELMALTDELLGEGQTVTIGDVDYQIGTVTSMNYQGDDTVAFTATATPYVTFFGETLFASSAQTITGQVVWSSDNEVVSIS